MSFFFAIAEHGMASLRAALAAIFCLACAAAAAESDAARRCRDADPVARIAACTEVIAKQSRGGRRAQAEAHIDRAAAHRAKGDPDRALADLDKALKLDPKSSRGLVERASLYQEKGNFDRAVADYDRALKLDEGSAPARAGRGRVFRSMGEFEKALADLDAAVALDPGSAALRLERAAIRRARGDIDSAIADLGEAIALDPRSAKAFLDRADAYREKRELDEARRDLEAASKLDPQSPAARAALDELNRSEETAPPVSVVPTPDAAKDAAHPGNAAGDHALPLITTLATALGLALLLGLLAVRIKLPALVGYLLAGVLIGPFTPGFVANTELAGELAEIGVMLLMFGVGLHFSLDDLLEVRKIAVPGAVLQIVVATALGAGVASLWGWQIGGSLVFGLALSVASTVVLLRALDARGALESMNGRIAVGWLVVEDLVMVLVLVLLPTLAGWLGGAPPGDDGSLWRTLGVTIAKVSAFIALMLAVGRRALPLLLWQVARTGSRELFTLCVVATAVSIAFAAAELFGVSFALGAFFAGMVMRESEFSHRAAEESLPLREAFAVLFFVSVGMLFDPMVLVEQPLHGLAVVGIIVIGKSIAAAVLVLFLGYPLNTALTVSASLAQIGEFSFILAGLGVSLGLLPTEGRSLILAGALISIAANPLVFAGIEPLLKWIRSRSALARRLERPADPLAELPMTTDEKYLAGQVVLVGYGRVGRRIGESLAEKGIPYVVVEQNRELVERLRSQGIAAVSGNASDPAVLVQAHIARASMLVIATPDTFDVRRMLESARRINPGVETVVRTHNEEEAMLLEQEAAGKVFFVEDELARGMSGHVLERYGKAPREVRA